MLKSCLWIWRRGLLRVVRPAGCQPGRLGRLLHAEPAGFVEFPQPGHDTLPWSTCAAIRFDQCPVGASFAVLVFEVLTDEHAADNKRQTHPFQTSSAHDITIREK
jgi:hypothetical protein